MIKEELNLTLIAKGLRILLPGQLSNAVTAHVVEQKPLGHKPNYRLLIILHDSGLLRRDMTLILRMY